ncbi:major facilitator superfamily domain-containing protein [Boletus edulis]|uniref:Major facilitator superfamily domain-containing protein n=1 Tax=Boletus edulis BED1 TaxID=1328754 RepID=A0AAD4BHR7_BOLED|nr:major facilitator superfamily domain-containing protein [Boletus edulis]KAF8129731.1 major facilitator superfamily domain-containing protein [Boletus edulis]KAF8429973.1 major facilitator superfamily domain-containing protein [Boletus edulis BED1]
MSPPAPGPPAKTLADGHPKRLSSIRKLFLLLLFCFAQFLESFSISALYPALPPLEASTGITQSQSAWILSAFHLTFASFLLISGRISDIYDPKNTLIAGVSSLGVLSICAGFVNNKIAILVLRAIMGIAAAMAIPSSLSLLVHVFPEPLEQARAIGVFGGCGAAGNVLGLLIGAVLVQYISYHWVFWFAAIIAIPLALACMFAIPPEMAKSKDRADPHIAKWKSIDVIGTFTLTAAFILFIYAVTSGPADGWATAGVLTPLIISIFLIAGFFYWETIVPVDKAAIPPRTWFYNNFAVLFGSALTPFLWWGSVFIVFTTLWQDVFHWTIISTAVHMLPVGVAAIIASCTGSLSRQFSPKWIILTGYSLTAVANVLCAVGGGRPEDYWTYIFPAFILGSAGASLTYAHTSIAIFQAAPASMAGTVSAIFNGALQLGSAIGIAALTAIQTSAEATHGGPQAYYGRAAAFWFLLGVAVIEILSLSYFYQRTTDHEPQLTLDDRDVVKTPEERSNEIDEVEKDGATAKGPKSLAV